MIDIPYILSFIIWLPVVAAIPVAFIHKKPNHARMIALVVSLICLVLSFLLYMTFDTQTAAMQFVENGSWIPSLKIHYALGVDGISMPLILLSSFTTLLIVIASWTMVKEKVGQYLATFLVMQGTVVGVFSALDSMLFYFFWEAMLIPMYISIGVWGMERRAYAAIKFFLYTFFGSALLLVALIYLRVQADSFYILDYYSLHIPMGIQILIFLGFLFAFAIKVPMWPVHTWLPDAHTEAPVGGSVGLAALMLKLGAYGFLRFSLPIVPDASRSLDWLMIALSLVAIVYIGLIAIAQKDMKKLIAYSSVAHMGIVTLGLFMIFVIIRFTGNVHDAFLSLEGAMVQMISHAFGSGAMFLAFGVLYQQLHSRKIADFGGVAKMMPYFSAFFMLFAMSNIALPGTSGFVGEFMVLLSAIKANFWIGFVASLTLIVAPAYTLWMYKRVFYGAVVNTAVLKLKDIGRVDSINFILLALVVIVLGIYPDFLLKVFHVSTDHLLHLSLESRL